MIVCHITPTIMSGIVVRWNPPSDDLADIAEVSASRDGVLICWPLMSTPEQRAELDKTIALAWDTSRMLANADARGPFSRITCGDVRAWLVERSVRVVDRHFGETLTEAMKREEAERHG